MFTFLQTLIACVVAFAVGVLCHAAVVSWVDRMIALAKAKEAELADKIRSKL